MARGTSLGELVTMLRGEIGDSLDPALGKSTREILVAKLARQQRRLWQDFDWPFLRVRRDVTLAAGQRYYDFPDDLVPERISHVETQVDGTWYAVCRGVTTVLYEDVDSDADERRDPACRWDIIDTGSGAQVEVWPIPETNGPVLRFHGIRGLAPLIENADLADLDDDLIVLFAAAEIAAHRKNEDAQALGAQANALYTRLKAALAAQGTVNLSAARRPWRPRELRVRLGQ